MNPSNFLHPLCALTYALFTFAGSTRTDSPYDPELFDYDDKVSHYVSDNISYPTTASLYQATDVITEGTDPRELRRSKKVKNGGSKKSTAAKSKKAKKPKRKSGRKGKKRGGKKGSAKNGKGKNVTPSSASAPAPDTEASAYLRYKGIISNPGHFYRTQVKFDEGDKNQTVLLYFKTPLKPSDIKGLLQKNRVKIMDPAYVSVNAEDMDKLEPHESSISWVYDEVTGKFYRYKGNSAKGSPLTAASAVSVEESTEQPNSSTAETDSGASNPDTPTSDGTNAAASESTDSSSDSLNASSEVAGAADAEGATAADNESSEGADSTVNDESHKALESSPNGEGNGDSPVAGDETDKEVTNDGGSTETSGSGVETASNTDSEATDAAATSDEKSVDAEAFTSAALVDESTKRKTRKGKKGKKARKSTEGSYTLVDENGEPTDKSAYKETIDGAIASATNEDGTPVLTSYKRLNEDGEVVAAGEGPGSSAESAGESTSESTGEPATTSLRAASGKKSALWSRRRVQNEVIATKKRVTKLESTVKKTEAKLQGIVTH
ncbi:uncharacterized protein BcabD6B2_57490 [Babesia caballi]|uniref:Membrane protein, putative n=1 Tax=Babesia caballi TaxID=5871 RepID=A0AAV4M1R4_BABCB|nr:membrane protein, putative [Babesia caballi]